MQIDLNNLTPEIKQKLREINASPLIWAETFLKSPNPQPVRPFKANFIQRRVMTSEAHDLWICVQRRGGKSYGIIPILLWHAITRLNCKIHCFFTSSVQRDEFFKTIDDWIRDNDLLQLAKAPSGNTKEPQVRTFTTGSVINGNIFTDQERLRGITADVVFVDEAQGLTEDDWKIVFPIMNGDITRRGKIRSYVAGTLNKAFGYYYEKIEKIGSVDNSHVLKINVYQNEDWTPEMVESERKKTPTRMWKTEYELEVAEEETAVFKKEDIDRTFESEWTPDSSHIRPNCPLFMSVDWDKVQCGTNILVMQYNPVYKSVRWIYHEEIPRSDWTYTMAVRRIVELFEHFRPYGLELVIVDQGASEKQWEDLRLEGMKNPGLGLTERLERLAFQSNIEVIDPESGEVIKRKIKPYLVERLRARMQNGLLKIPGQLDRVREQFSDYKIKETTNKTIRFSSTNEHIIDCCSFIEYAIYKHYENPFSEYSREHGNTPIVRIPREEDTIHNAAARHRNFFEEYGDSIEAAYGFVFRPEISNNYNMERMSV